MAPFLRKHWPLLGIGTLVVLVGILIFHAPKKNKQVSNAAGAAVEEGLRLEDIHYTQDSSDEKVKWILDAKEAKFSRDKEVISFLKFRLRLEPENRSPLELEGQRGDYDRKSGEIRLHGDLIGSTDDGYRIVTENAVYRHKQGHLETSDPVRITGPFFSIEGRGLLLNVEKETLRIQSNVITSIDKGSPIL